MLIAHALCCTITGMELTDNQTKTGRPPVLRICLRCHRTMPARQLRLACPGHGGLPAGDMELMSDRALAIETQRRAIEALIARRSRIELRIRALAALSEELYHQRMALQGALEHM